MSFPNSPGTYDRTIDRSFVVSGSGLLAGGVVVSAKRGPVKIKTVTSAKEFINTYGVPSRDNPSLYAALRFLNRAGILSVRRVINDAVSAAGALDYYDPLLATLSTPPALPEEGDAYIVGDDATGDWAGQEGKIATYTTGAWAFTDPDTHAIFTAANPGAWGNSVTVSFASIVGAPSGVFAVIVKENGQEVERFEVSRNPDAKNGFGANIYIEEVINNRSRYITVDDNPTVTADFNVAAVITLADGADDTVAPSSGDIVAAWDEFANVDEVPANILINAGWAVPAVQQKMTAIALARKDAVAILDVPEDDSYVVADILTYKDELALDSNVAGLYAGWLKIYDQYNDREVVIPPSGDVAGVFVHTVNVGERWDAPAGLQRGIIPNTLGVTKIFTEGERDQLYVNGVNPVTTFAGASAVVWGQKTLQAQASATDRFNVVNSVLWINQSIVKALQPFVFEPNTSFTRDSVNYLISSFLENVQLRGGLYGFSVDTSEDINTPFVIDNNQMMVDIYLKPTRTAEFIRVSTIITPTGVQLA